MTGSQQQRYTSTLHRETLFGSLTVSGKLCGTFLQRYRQG